MQIGNSPFFPKTKGRADVGRFFQGMKDGDILTAKVLARTGTKGQLRLLMNGKAVTLATPMDVELESGQEFRFSFVQGKKGMELKFLSFQDGKNQGRQEIVQSLQKHGQTIGQKLLQQLEEHMGQKTANLPQAAADKAGQALDPKMGPPPGVDNSDFPSFAAALSRGRNLHTLFTKRSAALEQIFSAIALKSDSPDKDFMPKLMSLGGLMMEKKMASFLDKPQFPQLQQLFANLVKEDAKAQALSMAAGNMEINFGIQDLAPQTSNPKVAATDIPDTDPQEALRMLNMLNDIKRLSTASTNFDNGSATMNQNQNGYPQGSLERISVDRDGVMSGHYSNGQNRELFVLGLSYCKNPYDLKREGGNLFAETPGCGGMQMGLAHLGNTRFGVQGEALDGLGSIASESLEQSNVDMGTEFVDMIITEKGFQANSKVVTTTDEILKMLNQLKR